MPPHTAITLNSLFKALYDARHFSPSYINKHIELFQRFFIPVYLPNGKQLWYKIESLEKQVLEKPFSSPLNTKLGRALYAKTSK